MRINSYAKAFPRDRRIYRIDRWTIPIPGGLPLAASAWFLVLAVLTLALVQVPFLDQAAAKLGWPATILVGPGALSIALTRPTSEGRTLPTHILCGARWKLHQFRARPALTRGQRSRALGVACDHTLAPRVDITGPGRVALDGVLTVALRAEGIAVATRDVSVRTARVATLAASERLEVRA